VGIFAGGVIGLAGWYFIRGARPVSGEGEAGAGDC
jgi:hypothetical protein